MDNNRLKQTRFSIWYIAVAFLIAIIPEPRVFDLVWPLGEKKGELEGNALVEILL
jgi:hypothetical protein